MLNTSLHWNTLLTQLMALPPNIFLFFWFKKYPQTKIFDGKSLVPFLLIQIFSRQGNHLGLSPIIFFECFSCNSLLKFVVRMSVIFMDLTKWFLLLHLPHTHWHTYTSYPCVLWNVAVMLLAINIVSTLSTLKMAIA